MKKRLSPWMAKTGQSWKLWVLLGGTIPLFLSLYEVVGDRAPSFWSVGFFLVFFLWFGWSAFAFRCPSCRGAVSWKLMRTISQRGWPGELFALKACPICAFDFDVGPSYIEAPVRPPVGDPWRFLEGAPGRDSLIGSSDAGEHGRRRAGGFKAWLVPLAVGLALLVGASALGLWLSVRWIEEERSAPSAVERWEPGTR